MVPNLNKLITQNILLLNRSLLANAQYVDNLFDLLVNVPTSVETIQISTSIVTKKIASHLINFAKATHPNKLTNITFRGCSFEDFSKISELLSVNNCIEVIEMVSCELSNDNVKEFFQQISRNETIKKLVICPDMLRNPNEGICVLLDQNKSVSQLEIENTSYSFREDEFELAQQTADPQDYITLFHSIAANTTIKHLELRGCCIDPEVSHMAVEYLLENSSLKHLAIVRQSFDAGQIGLWAELISKKKLEVLRLGEFVNTNYYLVLEICASDLEPFAVALGQNDSLIEFSLENIMDLSIDNSTEILKLFLDNIKSNTTICKLGLRTGSASRYPNANEFAALCKSLDELTSQNKTFFQKKRFAAVKGIMCHSS